MKLSLFLLVSIFSNGVKTHEVREMGRIPDDFIVLPRLNNPTDPEQIWLNYGTTVSSMAVSWATNATADSVVEWDIYPSTSFKNNATGNVTQYSSIGYTSPFLHMATMTNLQPSTLYNYRVGGSNSGWSATLTFTSSPSVSSSSYPYKLGVIGDLGQTNYSLSTILHVLDAKPNAVIITGDLSYADSTFVLWDSFGRLISPLSSAIPVHVAFGNHELELAIPPSISYDTRYRAMPYTASLPNNGPQYYSFNSGPLHMIALNSFGIYSVNSSQYNWLINDLNTIDRSKTPWCCVMLHAPWYSSNTEHQGDGELMRLTLEALLYQNQVAMVYVGHVHAYERTRSLFNNNLVDNGITYITIGDGGNREGLYTKWIDPQPTWSAVRQSIYGHGVVNFLNNTHLSWEWHEIANNETVVSDQTYVLNPYTG